MAEQEHGEHVSELVRRWVELVWREGPVATLGAVKLEYREEDAAAIRALRAAFPDVTATVKQQLVTLTLASDRAAKERWSAMALVTLRGTHRGEFLGVAPTGTAATWTRIDVLELRVGSDRFTADRIELVDGSNWDGLGLLHQLGVQSSLLPHRP
jgi:hypothetical protein